MPVTTQRITPFLWFDNQAEEAANFYTSIFKNSKVLATVRYTEEASQAAGRPAGSVMVVDFELEGQRFTALNGGPHFKFNEAISFVVHCQSQEEVDYYWDRLSQGGDAAAQQCGWLKDKFGVSWQITPTLLHKMLNSENQTKKDKVTKAFLQMKKFDIQKLREAYDS